ncbi:hypothetical protein GCK32_014604, partial [Trichostrongylus colubriformis]
MVCFFLEMSTPGMPSSSSIPLTDEPAALMSAMIKDLGNDVNKVKEEVAKYIQPPQRGIGTKSRILKVIAENTRDGKNLPGSRPNTPWRSLVKEIPLGRRRRADMSDTYGN